MKVKFILVLLIVAGLAGAQTVDSVVKEINASKLYVYDSDYEEIDVLKASAVRKEFVKIDVNGQTIEGLPVRDIDEDEGLVAVSLSQYSEPVWIETMSVEIWPGNRLDCPEVTLGESEIEKSGMTIGFGDHCKQPEEVEAEE